MEAREEEEEEQEEEEWLRPQQGASRSKSSSARSRVIVHVDLDCFYAQVEMLRAPDLRDKPLGIQQKSLVVTCNYEARRRGVRKLMPLQEAKERCPPLVLVNGEDLTPYREMSTKVTEFLRESCPLVERLGLDENFLDITQLVEERLKNMQRDGMAGIRVAGRVYKDRALDLRDPIHRKLAIASQIAEELRESLVSELGLTSSAGIASNKLLAKVVSETFKPNQQTLLLPESSQELLNNLEHIRKVPGIGSKTAQRLEALGVRSVLDLQRFPLALLEKELGMGLARRIRKLSYGEDEAPVTPSGPPQSLSDEDSFRKCSSKLEIQEKLEKLLSSLLERVQKDGRQPRTIRLTIRRGERRECRQCPIPPRLLPGFGKDPRSLLAPLLRILTELLGKMIPKDLPAHLNLLNVAFSNLQELPTRKGSIGFYLQGKGPSIPAGPQGSGKEAEDSQGAGSASLEQSTGIPKRRKLSQGNESIVRPGAIPNCPIPSLPPMEQEILRDLPEPLHRDRFHAGNVLDQPAVSLPKKIHNPSPNPMGFSSATRSVACSKPIGSSQASIVAWCHSSKTTLEYPRKAGRSMEKDLPEAGIIPPASNRDKAAPEPPPVEQTHSKEVVFPPHVDVETFYELPAAVQRELLAEWIQKPG